MRKTDRWCLVILCIVNFTGYAATNEHTRAEVDTRHIGAIYGDWEAAPLHNIGTNKTSIATKLGEPYPVAVRVFAEDGTYSETYATFEARWRVAYSRDDRPLKIERARIIKDAGANKTSETIGAKTAPQLQR